MLNLKMVRLSLEVEDSGDDWEGGKMGLLIESLIGRSLEIKSKSSVIECWGGTLKGEEPVMKRPLEEMEENRRVWGQDGELFSREEENQFFFFFFHLEGKNILERNGHRNSYKVALNLID